MFVFDAHNLPTEPSEIAQLLDEHHVVALSDRPRLRSAFCRTMTGHLQALPESQVIRIGGTRVTTLDGVCAQLETQLGARRRISRTVTAVIQLLQEECLARRQYLVWEEADAFLETDVQLFGQIANALFAVAAEREHISLDVLVLQRTLFVGSAKLGAYAEDETAQFRRWLANGEAHPYPEVAVCVSRPPVLTYRLDG